MPSVQMNYEEMTRMSQRFQAAAEELDAITILLARVSDALEDGALLGEAGSLLADSMQGEFIGGVSRLRDKLDEMAADVYGAMAALRDGDETARSKFSD